MQRSRLDGSERPLYPFYAKHQAAGSPERLDGPAAFNCQSDWLSEAPGQVPYSPRYSMADWAATRPVTVPMHWEAPETA